MTFIEEMEQSLIPSVEGMLKKSIEHLRHLKAEKEKIDKMPWYKRPFYSTELIDTCIIATELRIDGYVNKIVEYKEYVKKNKQNEKGHSKTGSLL